MRNEEKKICEIVLNGGTIIEKDEYDCEGIAVECFEVEYMNERYVMTKNNGEWVFFHHRML